MRIVNDYSELQIASPALNADMNPRVINAKPALYQSGALVEPTAQKANAQVSVLSWASNYGTPATAYKGAATPADVPADTTLPNLGDMPSLVESGPFNGGTTTLAEIMTYLGVPMTEADIDKAIQRNDESAASPEDMLRFARDNGLEAEEYNNATWDDLTTQIDQGHPVQAAISYGGKSDIVSSNELRYINVVGHGTDPATGEEYITYRDPADGADHQMSRSDFEKLWGNIGGPYQNYFQAYAPGGTELPPGSNGVFDPDTGLQGQQGALNGFANIQNGWDRMFGNGTSIADFSHGGLELVGGVFQLCFCTTGALVQAGAGWLHDKVAGIPVLENIVQPLTDLVGGAGAIVADVFNGIGETADDLGGAAEDLFHGDGRKALGKLKDAGEDLVAGAAHGLEDAAKSLGNSIEDLFSW
jgi:predicted double-glycine peptidase